MGLQQVYEFHMPPLCLENIISHFCDDGVEGLKNWLAAGKEGKEAVYSPTILSRVRLDRSHHFVQYSLSVSIYYNFFMECLRARNPYALYAQSLRLAFNNLDLEGSLSILHCIKFSTPIATLAFLIINNCKGISFYQNEELLNCYLRFKSTFRLASWGDLGEQLMYHISLLEPRNRNSYGSTWVCEFSPNFWDHDHFFDMHSPDTICHFCVFFYLSKEICKLS